MFLFPDFFWRITAACVHSLFLQVSYAARYSFHLCFVYFMGSGNVHCLIQSEVWSERLVASLTTGKCMPKTLRSLIISSPWEHGAFSSLKLLTNCSDGLLGPCIFSCHFSYHISLQHDIGFISIFELSGPSQNIRSAWSLNFCRASGRLVASQSILGTGTPATSIVILCRVSLLWHRVMFPQWYSEISCLTTACHMYQLYFSTSYYQPYRRIRTS